MFSLVDPRRRYGRRTFLRFGSALGLTGTLAGLSGWPSAWGQTGSLDDVVQGKSVILLFLHGGPSQTETFDPKMTAPAGVRSVTGEISTALPGVTFGASFPGLAERADRLSIVRSFQTGNGNHDIKPVVSTHSASANIGSVFSRVAGTNAPGNGMPTNVALFPRAVDERAQPANKNFGRFEATGPLGAAYAPFIPGSGSGMGEDLKLKLAPDRLQDRRQLLDQLDRFQRQGDRAGGLVPDTGLQRLRDQAFETILGGVSEAFDLQQEDPRIVAEYDTAPLVRPEQIDRKWNNYNNYIDNARSLGKLLLLARRLCQRGCGFVTVTTNFVWDMHSDVNNAGVEEGMRYMGLPLDHAVSVYLDDVRRLGLQRDILLVVCGEMGRTPRVNNRGGRDHWGNLAPLLLAGGGLNMGQVIGQSSADAGEPASEPIGIPQLLATMLHTLLDVGQVRTMTNLPAAVQQTITGAEPIASLL